MKAVPGSWELEVSYREAATCGEFPYSELPGGA